MVPVPSHFKLLHVLNTLSSLGGILIKVHIQKYMQLACCMKKDSLIYLFLSELTCWLTREILRR